MRRPVRLAWVVWALSVLIWGLGLGLSLLTGASAVIENQFFLLVLFVYSTVGVLVAAHYPHNAVGWLLLHGLSRGLRR
jgi:hypothetical protein